MTGVTPITAVAKWARMANGDQCDKRERLRELNTKGYYLLVALSFIYFRNWNSLIVRLSVIFTAVAAAFPLQDLKVFFGECWLEFVRVFKILLLAAAVVLIVIALARPAKSGTQSAPGPQANTHSPRRSKIWEQLGNKNPRKRHIGRGAETKGFTGLKSS